MREPTQSTMHAVGIDRFGGPETMAVKELPVPEPGPNEILIRVESAGVGVWDPFEREGGFAKMFDAKPHFPYVMGSDGAGVVVAAGNRVTRFKEGDRVYGFALMNPKGGFYAEYVAINEDEASLVPNNVPTDCAGAMAVDAITALQGLDDQLRIKSGESLMIFGASGGIGHLATQLAKRMGARVFAIASGNDGVELVKKLGADVVVDGHKDDVVAEARKFAPEGVDAALLTAGGEAAEKALTTICQGGRIAYPNGVEPPKVRSDVKVHTYNGTPTSKSMAKLNKLIEAGSFEVHISQAYSLDRAADAHQALDKHFVGKLALRMH